MDWYQKNNYFPLIPEGVTIDNLNEIVNRDFNEEEYRFFKEQILKEFDLGLFEKLEKQTGKKFPEEIIVYLTSYGMAGSYNLPNIIVLNFKKTKDLLNCLKHELIHILIEDEVQKRGLSQKEKEAWVKELMDKVV